MRISAWRAVICARAADLPADRAGGRLRGPNLPGRGVHSDAPPRGAGDRCAGPGRSRGLYAAETQARREASVPPFGRLAAIIISSEDHAEAHEGGAPGGGRCAQRRWLCRLWPRPCPAIAAAQDGIVSGCSSMPGAMSRCSGSSANVTQPMRWAPGVRVAVDVDPYSFV